MAGYAGGRRYLESRRWCGLIRFNIAASVAVLLSGCVGDGVQPMSAMSPNGASIAFESIDGLPQNQFTKLVRLLSEEAQTRQLAVVTRDTPSQFRARGYASAQVHGKHTVIAWVWDIYDAQQQRAWRISGEQASSTTVRGWAAADDQVLHSIARESLSQLADFLRNPGSTTPAAPPEQPASGPAVAFGEPSGAERPSSLQNVASFNSRPDQ
jgi:hypothetical protein